MTSLYTRAPVPGTLRPVSWTGQSQSLQAGYSVTLGARGRVSITVPTGTTRAVITDAGALIYVPLRDISGLALTGNHYPVGAVSLEYVSGFADAGNTGITLWTGIVDSTTIGSANGGGGGAIEDGAVASMSGFAWRISAGTPTKGATGAGTHDAVASTWSYTAVARRMQFSYQTLNAGAAVSSNVLTAAGTLGTGALYLVVAAGLVDAADNGGTVVLDVRSSLVPSAI